MLKKFNIYKIAQASAYLQNKADAAHYMKLIKLVFFADRYHLRHWGSLFTFDKYIAIKLGPSGSSTKDIYTFYDFFYNNEISNEQAEYLKKIIKPISDFEIEIQETNKDHLSISTIKSLDFSAKHFGKFDEFELSNITHDYPEWKRYEHLFNNKLTDREDILLEDFFENPDLSNSKYIIRYLGNDPFDEDPSFISAMKEDFVNNHHQCI